MNHTCQLISIIALAARPSVESPNQYHKRPHPQQEVNFNQLIFAEIGGATVYLPLCFGENGFGPRSKEAFDEISTI